MTDWRKTGVEDPGLVVTSNRDDFPGRLEGEWIVLALLGGVFFTVGAVLLVVVAASLVL